MKKVLAIFLCAAMMFAFAVPAMAVVNVTANSAAITIDGVRDEAYAGPLDIATPNRDAEGVLTGVGEASAAGKGWTAWDGGNSIYLYIEVYDKTPNHDDFGAESVEIFLDWNAGQGDADVATDETPFWQVRLSPVDPEDMTGYSRTAAGANWSTGDFLDLCEWKVIPLDGSYNNGYIIEVKIGAPSVAPLSEGKIIPFDLQVCDNSQGDGRDGQKFLAHVGEGIDDNSRWNTAMNLQGSLTLGGAYVAPAAPVEEAAAPAEAADAEIAPVVTATTTPSVRTGDSTMIFVILAMVALAGAFVVTRRVSKNRA